MINASSALRHDPADVLASLIAKNMRLYRIDKEELAEALCMSRTTMYNRLRAPSCFSFCELQLLFSALHFTDEDIMSLLSPMSQKAS